ncbi:uncharacterized protein UV8b_00203 [Ustilaginoidea virens]|uniref:DUF1308 domain-containing protein n=1 Tax=Ustilaginoidea virens TaxID=1159556 RepID=A0A8E5MDV8_USTVR|nr:uncharacterized protein UV8b_00203 [Ustilaginoidea virens]QUC15962.1 hypothetical protein UV8b_00203 [Ustilaginoidea virens]
MTANDENDGTAATRGSACRGTSTHASGGTCLENATQHQRKLLVSARTALSISQSYVAEVEVLLEELSAGVETPHTTGLPTFLHNGKKNQSALQDLIRRLSASVLSKDSLQRIERKLDVCSVEVSQASTHWDVLKRCHSLVAVNRTFQGSARASRDQEIASMPNLSSRQKELAHRVMKQQAKVEAHVVRGGAEWIAVRFVQQDRLARQMADGGWGWGEHRSGDVVDEGEWGDVPLAKQVRRLVAATRVNRRGCPLPRLRIVLPNIGRDSPDVAVLLDQLGRLDPSVEVVIEDGQGSFLGNPPPAVDVAVRNLLGNELDGLTETLNVDLSILIDLVSDITHSRLEPRPWQAQSTRAQMADEMTGRCLMTQVLYPVLAGRALVCTREAAEHFHRVLSTVGTASERERGKLLVPLESAPGGTLARARFRELSAHALPDTVQIPVRVLADTWTQASIEGRCEELGLPGVARYVASHGGFKRAKLSIFMYGWASGNVTLTSNKEIGGQIRTLVERFRQSDDECGPAIWVVDVTRNLVGNEGHKPADGRHECTHTRRL